MASSNTSDPPLPPPSGETSYSKMSVGDVEQIGARCQAPFCHQLDFLPFKCESCKGKFCQDHRTEDAHSCTNAGAWARARREQNEKSSTTSSSTQKPSILTHESQCSFSSCKTLINTPLVPGIECATCNRSYCLKHRMKEDHDCANLPPIGGRTGASSREKTISDALGKLRAWGAAKKSSVSSSKPSTSSGSGLSRTTTASSTASIAPTLHRIISPFSSKKKSTSTSSNSHVVTLKRSAKGDNSVPDARRVYVHMEAVASGEGQAGAKVPRADAFFDTNWSVGKVLDSAAKTLGVVNVNNRGGGEEQRLRVFHIEGGRLLPFSEKLGEKVRTGDTVVLLRGVGAAEASAAEAST